MNATASPVAPVCAEEQARRFAQRACFRTALNALGPSYFHADETDTLIDAADAAAFMEDDRTEKMTVATAIIDDVSNNRGKSGDQRLQAVRDALTII